MNTYEILTKELEAKQAVVLEAEKALKAAKEDVKKIEKARKLFEDQKPLEVEPPTAPAAE